MKKTFALGLPLLALAFLAATETSCNQPASSENAAPSNANARTNATPQQTNSANNPADVDAIKAVYPRVNDAIKSRDVNGIMANYAPGNELVVFDLIPPRQYVGWDAYKKDWEGFLADFKGPITSDVTDLHAEADGSLGYARAINRVAGTDSQGKKMDITVRLTDVLKKIDGKWLIVHEHVSVPVDVKTGKPDFTSKP